MGNHQGFDFFPPLKDNDTDNKKWALFLEAVLSHYREEKDGVIEFTPADDIVFAVGEHPWLPGPNKGHRFRRFSAKVSGSLCGNVRHYLQMVEEICESHFGYPSRVRHWREYGNEGEPEAFYEWSQVLEEQGGWKGILTVEPPS